MGTKNISIPDDVYDKLREVRRADESFGDTINRLLGDRPISEFWGVWDEETAEAARAAIESGRSLNADRLERLFGE